MTVVHHNHRRPAALSLDPMHTMLCAGCLGQLDEDIRRLLTRHRPVWGGPVGYGARGAHQRCCGAHSAPPHRHHCQPGRHLRSFVQVSSICNVNET